jgi:hypothetical protein
MMRKLLSAILVLGACMFAQSAYSQGPPPGNGTSAPIDGATGALLVVVAGYGYSKLKKKEAEEAADKPSA